MHHDIKTSSEKAIYSAMEASEKTVSTNRKAFSDFDILEKFEAGIILTGSEVKSVREGKVNLKDSYALIKQEEALLFNCHISSRRAAKIEYPTEQTSLPFTSATLLIGLPFLTSSCCPVT